MRLRNSIAARLVVVIMLFSAAIYALTLSYNFYESRKALQREVETNSRNLAMSLVNLVDARLTAVAKVTEGLARTVETMEPDEAELLSLLRGTVASNPEIVGSAAAFEPFAFDGRREYFAPYYYRSEAGLSLSRLEETYLGAPYVQSDWYQIPARAAAARVERALLRRGRRQHADDHLLGAVLRDAGRPTGVARHRDRGRCAGGPHGGHRVGQDPRARLCGTAVPQRHDPGPPSWAT